MTLRQRLRCWAGERLVRLGLRMLGGVEGIERTMAQEDEHEGVGEIPYPPVVLNDEARRMVREGIVNKPARPPPPASNEERPLRGSVQERLAQLRKEW